MSQPITITATVAVWADEGYGIRDLCGSLERNDRFGLVQALAFYGPPEKETFGDWVRVGEADVTVRLIPRDALTRNAVQSLQKKLAEERVKWHERQEAILAEISKLSALEYVEAE